jgi:hypothetical protein
MWFTPTGKPWSADDRHPRARSTAACCPSLAEIGYRRATALPVVFLRLPRRAHGGAFSDLTCASAGPA